MTNVEAWEGASSSSETAGKLTTIKKKRGQTALWADARLFLCVSTWYEHQDDINDRVQMRQSNVCS